VISTTRLLFGGEVNLWLAETAYPLPGQNDFLPDYPRNKRDGAGGDRDSPGTISPRSTPRNSWYLCPGRSFDLPNTLLGVLQITRPPKNAFEPAELELVRALASLAAANLQVYRQMVIKNWRFEQLALVRSVSFQIANVLDLDELSRRVTRLILHTFKYYYVAIFTLTPGLETLHFRASARFSSKSTSQIDSKLLFRSGWVKALSGSVAQTGEELVACKVAEEPLYRFVETLPRNSVRMRLSHQDRGAGARGAGCPERSGGCLSRDRDLGAARPGR